MRADRDTASPGAESMLTTGMGLVEKAEAAEWRARQILNERIR
jgi:hypothetical protein